MNSLCVACSRFSFDWKREDKSGRKKWRKATERCRWPSLSLGSNDKELRPDYTGLILCLVYNDPDNFHHPQMPFI